MRGCLKCAQLQGWGSASVPAEVKQSWSSVQDVCVSDLLTSQPQGMSQLELTSKVFLQAMPALVWANQECVSMMVWGWVSLQHLKAGMRDVQCDFLPSWHDLGPGAWREPNMEWREIVSSSLLVPMQGLHTGFCQKWMVPVAHLQIKAHGLLSDTPHYVTTCLHMGRKVFWRSLKALLGEIREQQVWVELLLTTASFGGQNSTRTWHQPSIFSSEKLFEQ